ncbi:hypothetical protein B0H14DRAFT_2820069 [Mycena olivaceomarginata]|nr:hypothetical protein B0H14DRAFT_2820069 [Mycena olivaceomarginata]
MHNQDAESQLKTSSGLQTPDAATANHEDVPGEMLKKRSRSMDYEPGTDPKRFKCGICGEKSADCKKYTWHPNPRRLRSRPAKGRQPAGSSAIAGQPFDFTFTLTAEGGSYTPVTAEGQRIDMAQERFITAKETANRGEVQIPERPNSQQANAGTHPTARNMRRSDHVKAVDYTAAAEDTANQDREIQPQDGTSRKRLRETVLGEPEEHLSKRPRKRTDGLRPPEPRTGRGYRPRHPPGFYAKLNKGTAGLNKSI